MPQLICLLRHALLAVAFLSLSFTPFNNSVFSVGRPPPTASCFRSDPCAPPVHLRGRIQPAPAQLGHTLEDVEEPSSSFSPSSPFDERADRVQTPLELVPHLASALQLQLINVNSSSSNSSEFPSEAVRKRAAITGSQARNSNLTDTNSANNKALAFCVRDDGSVEQDESALAIRVEKKLPAEMINANEDDNEPNAHRTDKASLSLVVTIASHAQRCFVLIQSTYAING